jgi:hypothetical protein
MCALEALEASGEVGEEGMRWVRVEGFICGEVGCENWSGCVSVGSRSRIILGALIQM